MRIETNSRQVVLHDEDSVAIVESFEDEDVVQLISSTKKNDDGTSSTNPPTCRVAKAKPIPPRSEAPVMARTMQGSTVMLESIPNISDETSQEWQGQSGNPAEPTFSYYDLQYVKCVSDNP